LQESLAAAEGDVNWVAEQNLHVTLLFLGEVDVRETLSVCRVVQDVAAATAPFSIRLAGVGCFPNTRRPRVLWAGIEDGTEELIRLHQKIEVRILELGSYRREDRTFTPHVTLGRVKGEGDSQAIVQTVREHSEWNGGVETVTEVHVMSSELTRDGSQYTILGRGKLLGQNENGANEPD
jgi:2'-5' RNA ligase